MPFINNDFIKDLPNKVDIITLISKRIALKKAGKGYKACCPFHQEKTPSFTVSSEKQSYYCFGCGESGNALNFVQKFDNLDFVESVERLASEFGITVEYDKNSKPIDKNIENLRALSLQIGEFYIKQLKTSPIKQIAIDYAKNRGISGEIAKRFGIGFAPININLYKEFEESAIIVKNLLALGLIIEDDNNPGKYFDRFRDRLMFPIHNAKNQVIGFGGRVLGNSKKTAKYLNSSASPIFDKSSELYGLYHARKYSKKLDYLLVVEGYMDVVALHQGGITAVVATLGTATTNKHLQILKRSSNNIIFCFDGDSAGFKAAVKALTISLPLLSANMQIKFLFLPDGEDPDSLIKKESQIKFEQRIINATTLSEFLFSHIKAKVNFSTIEGKTEFLQTASGLISLVQYGIYKGQLLQGLADEIGQNLATIIKIIDNKPIKKLQDNTVQVRVVENNSNIMKAYIAKLISIILNTPALANDSLLEKIKKIPKTEILQELIISAQFIDNPSAYLLIQPFKNNIKIYNRLWFLANSCAKLNTIDADNELYNTLENINNYQSNKGSRQEITKVLTNQDEADFVKKQKLRKSK